MNLISKQDFLLKFPELSRHEMNSMKASEAFLKGLHKRFGKKDRKKVFIVGFHKTGTSSMGKAFQILGYRVCGSIKEGMNFEEVDRNPREYIFEKALHLTPKYDCFQDTPWFMFYKELHKAYPDAYFILTKRPEEDWIRSVTDHFGHRNNSNYHKWIYGTEEPISNEERYLNKYREHNKSVIEYFGNNKNFITVNLSQENKWEQICELLDIPQPIFNYPYVNTKKSRKQLYSVFKQKIKRLYYQ